MKRSTKPGGLHPHRTPDRVIIIGILARRSRSRCSSTSATRRRTAAVKDRRAQHERSRATRSTINDDYPATVADSVSRR